MSQLLYRPATLARALYAGSQAARAAATDTDPDAGGVGLALQPDGSLRIYSAAGESFSRAYADPAPRTDTGDEALLAVLSLHGTQTLLARLAELDDTYETVELRADAVGVYLVRDLWVIFASASNKADTLSPVDTLAVRPRDMAGPVPPSTPDGAVPDPLWGLHAGLCLDLLTGGPAMGPEDSLDAWAVRERDDLLAWHLGDWALGRTHAAHVSPRG